MDKISSSFGEISIWANKQYDGYDDRDYDIFEDSNDYNFDTLFNFI